MDFHKLTKRQAKISNWFNHIFLIFQDHYSEIYIRQNLQIANMLLSETNIK